MAEPEPAAGDDALAIVATTAKVSRVFKIGGYAALKGFPTGASWRGPLFPAGNQHWYIAYLPNGDTPENADYLSMFLVRASGPAMPMPAMASFGLALLDRNHEPVRGCTQKTGFLPFAAPGARQGFPKFLRRAYLERSRHLNNDEFFVRFDVSVLVQVRSEDSTAPTLPPPPPPATARLLGELLMSGEGADVTFVVEGEAITAHRCILAAWSPVFRAGLWGSTMDGNSRDPIEIRDMSAEVFKILLEFLYTERLPELHPDERVPLLQRLLVAADRYDIGQLKIVCELNLCHNMGIQMAASSLMLAEQHNCPLLKSICLRFIEAPGAYEAVIQTADFWHLSANFPGLIVEIMARVGPRSA